MLIINANARYIIYIYSYISNIQQYTMLLMFVDDLEAHDRHIVTTRVSYCYILTKLDKNSKVIQVLFKKFQKILRQLHVSRFSVKLRIRSLAEGKWVRTVKVVKMIYKASPNLAIYSTTLVTKSYPFTSLVDANLICLTISLEANDANAHNSPPQRIGPVVLLLKCHNHTVLYRRCLNEFECLVEEF